MMLKPPTAANKLEQLKLIDSLTKEKAWMKDPRHFVVEEAFRQYYNEHIPIAVIILLCSLETRYHAFSSYIKVAGFLRFNKETNKIISLSPMGQNIRVVGLLVLLIFTFHVVGVLLYIAYILLLGSETGDNIIRTIFGASSCAAALIFLNIVRETFFRVTGLKADFRRFERELIGHIETTAVYKDDKIVIGLLLGILAVAYLGWLFYKNLTV